MASHVDYSKLNRKELQALCKQHKIPANKTNVFMAEALDALLNNAPRQQEEFQEEEPPTPDSPEVEKVVEKVKGKQARRKSVLPDPELNSLTDMLAQSSLEPTVAEQAPYEADLQEKTLGDTPSVDNLLSPAPIAASAAKGRRGRPRKVNPVVDAPMAEAFESEENPRIEDQKPRRGRKKAEKVNEEIPSLSPAASHFPGSFLADISPSGVEPVPTAEFEVEFPELEAGGEESMEGVDESESWAQAVDVVEDPEQSIAPADFETHESDEEVPPHAVDTFEAIRHELQTLSDTEEIEVIAPVPLEKKKKGGKQAKKGSKSRRNMKDEAETEAEVPEELFTEVAEFSEQRERELPLSPAQKIQKSKKGRKGVKSRRGVEDEEDIYVFEELKDEVVTSGEVIDAVAEVDDEMERETLPSPVEKSKKGRKPKKVVKPRRNVETEAEQDFQGGEEMNDEGPLPGESSVTEADSMERSEVVVQSKSFSWTIPTSVLEEEIPVPPKKSLPPAFTISPYIAEKKPRRRAKGPKKAINPSEEPMEDLCPEQEVEQTENIQEPVTPLKDHGATGDGDDKENLKDDLVHLSMRKLMKKCKEKGLKAQGTANTTRSIKL